MIASIGWCRGFTGLLAAVLLFVGWSRITALEPKREEGRLSTQPELPYFRYLPDAEPRGRVLVVPGLNSNKEFMQGFGVLQSGDRIVMQRVNAARLSTQ